jgi:hypothetical protein
MSASGRITIVAGPHDRAVVTDPAFRYRPDKIEGRRYRTTATTPDPPQKPATE